MAYATVADVQNRIGRTLDQTEQTTCTALLEDAAVIIDAFAGAREVPADVLKVVSCRMVVRAIGSGGDDGVPIGATQGSMSGLGYAQSWTMGSGGAATGELYLGRLEKQMLRSGNRIGSYSPVQDLAAEVPG